MCSRICEAAKCAHIINQTSKHVTMRRSWLCEIICVCRQLYYGVLTCHTCSRLFRRLSRWRAVITSIQNNFFIVGNSVFHLCTICCNHSLAWPCTAHSPSDGPIKTKRSHCIGVERPFSLFLVWVGYSWRDLQQFNRLFQERSGRQQVWSTILLLGSY